MRALAHSVVLFGVIVAVSLHAQTTAPVRDAGGVHAPTEALERGRRVYVLNSCHFCHGIDLTGATMGAADLMHSPLVGSDRDGNVIGAIVNAGLPNLQTAMPSYADLTPAEIVDLARYVHFLRQQGRYRELLQSAPPSVGDVSAGRSFFTATCASCHAPASLAGVVRKSDALALRGRVLRPGPAMPTEGVAATSGDAAHLTLLENYTAAQLDDVLAYLRTLR